MIFVVILAIGLSTSIGTAWAQDSPPRIERSIENNEASVSIVLNGTIRSGHAAPGSVPDWPYDCTFANAFTNTEVILGRADNPIRGQRYWLSCLPKEGRDVLPIGEWIVFDPADPVPGVNAIAAEVVRDAARANLPIPDLAVGRNPDFLQITGIDTWFWPDGDTNPIGSAANVNGLEVEVQAQWNKTTFELGDGNILECERVEPWSTVAPETDCAHMYLEDLGPITVSAVSEWSFFWHDNFEQPEWVFWETVTATEIDDLEVHDLEAVISKRPR